MPNCRTGALLPCPYLRCPKRGQSQQVIRFGFYRHKRGRRRRYRCDACGQTYGRTTHTLYHRLRASQAKPAQMILYASGSLSRSDFHP